MFTKNRKKRKMILVIFGSFLIIFYYIFDLCILKFVFERSIWLQRKILEARFWAPNSNFYFYFFRTSGRNFECSTEISNARPDIRAFDRKFERSTRNSNVRPEIWTFDRKFERSTGNSNFRPESRTFGPMSAWDHMGQGPHEPRPTWWVLTLFW